MNSLATPLIAQKATPRFAARRDAGKAPYTAADSRSSERFPRRRFDEPAVSGDRSIDAIDRRFPDLEPEAPFGRVSRRRDDFISGRDEYERPGLLRRLADWRPRRKHVTIAGLLAALYGVGWVTHASFRDDGQPTIAGFYDPAGNPSDCRVSSAYNVFCNGWRRGSITETGRADNVWWPVGHVNADGALWFQVHDGPLIRVGKIQEDGKVYDGYGSYVGLVQDSPDAWDTLSKQEKGAAAILALRPDANNGVWEVIIRTTAEILRALAEAMSDDSN